MTSAPAWRRPVVLLAALLVLAALLRAGAAASALLSGDEAYYWLWSRRLQLSYFDHPGMAAWWMAASTALFGDSAWAVRLPAQISSILVTLLVFDAAKTAFDDSWAGLWAAVLLNATILFAAAGVTATPDGPLLVFWTAALACQIRLLKGGGPIWIYGLGAALGLGFCSKYTMTLIAPGVLAAFLLFPAGRAWARRSHFYLAILLALACTAPVLVWNHMHDWVSFKKQLAHSFDGSSAGPGKSLATFLATQIGVATPLVLGFALWGMVWALWAGWRRQRAEWFLLGASSAPVLAFFIHHSFGGLVQPHWAGPAYLGGLAAAAGAWRLAPRRRWLDLTFKAAPILGGVMTLLVYLQMATGILPLPARSDPLGRLGGWDEVAAAVEQELQARPGAFVFVQKHELSGLLTFYLPGHPKAYLTGSAGIPRIPSYDAEDVRTLPGRDGLFVAKASPEGVRDASRFFERMSLVRSLDRHWGGRVIDRYEIWLAEGYRRGTFEDRDGEKAGGTK